MWLKKVNFESVINLLVNAHEDPVVFIKEKIIQPGLSVARHIYFSALSSNNITDVSSNNIQRIIQKYSCSHLLVGHHNSLIPFYFLECPSHILSNWRNRWSDDNVIFVFQGKFENVDKCIYKVGHLGVGPELASGPTLFTFGGPGRVQKLSRKMVPRYNLEKPLMIMDTCWFGLLGGCPPHRRGALPEHPCRRGEARQGRGSHHLPCLELRTNNPGKNGNQCQPCNHWWIIS